MKVKRAGRRAAARAFLAAALAFCAQGQAPNAAAAGAGVAFRDTVVARATGVASITLSPDGARLYATTLFGALLRWRIDPATGALSEPETLELPYFRSPAGPRGLTGLAFDPDNPNRLWVADNHPVPLNGSDPSYPDFSGRISIVDLAPDGSFHAEARPYVVGLPRSCADHVTNSLVFRDVEDPATGATARRLYVSQGSNTAKGAADRRWCDRPERLLSAAVLEIDPRRDPPPGGFDVATEPLPVDGAFRRFGAGGLLETLLGSDGLPGKDAVAVDGGPHAGGWLRFDARGVAMVRAGRDADAPVTASFYDPFAPDAPVRLFATGVRNAYDFAFGPDGLLYAPVNGAGGGGKAPDDPTSPLNESAPELGREEDRLLILARGDYGGHPNPLRREYVANGGNPSPGPDHDEVSAYPVGVAPYPRLRLDRVIPLGFHWSPTGTVFVPAEPCAPALCGALLFANYSKGNTLRAMIFDDVGRVASDFMLRDPDGREIAHRDPIDLAVGPAGRIYLATLERSNGASRIVLLEPAIFAAAHGTLSIRLIDAAIPSTALFRVASAGGGASIMTVSVDGGPPETLTPDAAGVIRLTLPDAAAGDLVEAVFDVATPTGTARLARIGFIAGAPGPTLAADGPSFEAATDAQGLIAGVIRSPDDADSRETEPGADANGDGFNDDYSGRGYFDFAGPVGSEASLLVDVPEAGAYEIILRLANGSRDPRPLRIEVAATGDSATLADTRSGGWDQWRDHVATLLLERGANRLRLLQTGAQGPNVDHVTIRPGG